MSDLGNKKIFAENLAYQMDLHGKKFRQMEAELGFPYSTIKSWATGENYPRIDKIEKLANYFGITKADLIEKQDHGTENTNHKISKEEDLPPLTPRDEREIARDLEKMLADLDDKNGLAAVGGTVEDEEDRELLRASLLTSMQLAKKIAKKKFTPKKYRKDDKE